MSQGQLRESALKPVIIALLSSGLTIAGTVVKDRLTTERDRATTAAQIDGLTKRVDAHEQRLTWMNEELPTREELRSDMESLQQRLDDIRTIVATEARRR